MVVVVFIIRLLWVKDMVEVLGMRLSFLWEAKYDFSPLSSRNALGLTLGQSKPLPVKPKVKPKPKPYPIPGSRFWRAWCRECGDPIRVPADEVVGAICQSCDEPGRKIGKVKASGKGGVWRSAGLASGKGAREVAQAGGRLFGDVSPGTQKR